MADERIDLVVASTMTTGGNPRRVIDREGERDHFQVEDGNSALELSIPNSMPDKIALVAQDDLDGSTCVYLTAIEATELIHLLAARVHQVLGRG